MSISSTIKSIQDIMRKDVGVDGDAQQGIPIDRRHLFHAPHFT